MSKITLEDLRADFEANIDKALWIVIETGSFEAHHNGDWRHNPDDFVTGYESDLNNLRNADMSWLDEKSLGCVSQARKAYIATKLYLIAREEGVAAALLWKLAN